MVLKCQYDTAMWTKLAIFIWFSLESVVCPAQDSRDLNRHIYPLAPGITCPEIVLDFSDSPESEKWANTAKELVREWFSTVCSLLATDGKNPTTGLLTGKPFVPDIVLRLVFKKEIGPPAFASGNTITVNGKWIAAHPEDLGMMIHELTHIVQAYPNAKTTPGWLVEGIADYIRWWKYEPELHATSGRTKVNPEKASYKDSYRTTAVWLAWCSRKYDMALVPSLDYAMRNKEDPMPVFQTLTKKTADELWQEFVDGIKP